jgi:hypothetical protein
VARVEESMKNSDALKAYQPKELHVHAVTL